MKMKYEYVMVFGLMGSLAAGMPSADYDNLDLDVLIENKNLDNAGADCVATLSCAVLESTGGLTTDSEIFQISCDECTDKQTVASNAILVGLSANQEFDVEFKAYSYDSTREQLYQTVPKDLK